MHTGLQFIVNISLDSPLMLTMNLGAASHFQPEPDVLISVHWLGPMSILNTNLENNFCDFVTK